MNPISAYRIHWHNKFKPWWRGWHRPWQAENDAATDLNARRAFTKRGAERRMARATMKAGRW